MWGTPMRSPRNTQRRDGIGSGTATSTAPNHPPSTRRFRRPCDHRRDYRRPGYRHEDDYRNHRGGRRKSRAHLHTRGTSRRPRSSTQERARAGRNPERELNMAPSAATITAVESFIQMAEAFLPASVKPYVADLLVDGPEGLAAYAAIKAGLAAVSAKTCVGYV